MRVFVNHFSRWHVGIFLVLWLMFAVWTFLIVRGNLDDAHERPVTVAATTVGSVLGPMSGAISRNFQSCCWQFSLSLLPYCLAALGFAALVQVIGPSNARWLTMVRLVVWTAGLIVWFGGGITSFGHALS